MEACPPIYIRFLVSYLQIRMPLRDEICLATIDFFANILDSGSNKV